MRKTVENIVENVKNKLSDWGKKGEERERDASDVETGEMWKVGEE